MEYAFTVTDAGRYLIARLLTGEEMHITKIMVGEGRMPDNVRMASITDLYEPIAQATSDEPKCDRGVAYLTVEYNSSLNGGLERGFWLREFGIFAMDPVDGEILLAYANLGDVPQWVCAYEQSKGVDVRRFPVQIAIGEDRGMVVDYHTDLWMTAEDVRSYFELNLMPIIRQEIADGIAAHNRDPEAHFGFARFYNTKVGPRIALAEAMEELSGVLGDDHAGYENEYIATFETLDAVDATGNWNEVMARIEF